MEVIISNIMLTYFDNYYGLVIVNIGVWINVIYSCEGGVLDYYITSTSKISSYDIKGSDIMEGLPIVIYFYFMVFGRNFPPREQKLTIRNFHFNEAYKGLNIEL